MLVISRQKIIQHDHIQIFKMFILILISARIQSVTVSINLCVLKLKIINNL